MVHSSVCWPRPFLLLQLPTLLLLLLLLLLSILLHLQMRKHSFNVFRLSKYSGKPLKAVFLGAVEEFGLAEKLHMDSSKLESLADDLQAAYNRNPYHSALHAADTTQMMAYLLHQDNLAAALSPLDMFALLLAAAGHDAAHCGERCLLQFNSCSRL
jgi:hypothetical protein